MLKPQRKKTGSVLHFMAYAFAFAESKPKKKE